MSARGHHVLIGCPPESQLYERAPKAGLPAIAIPFQRTIDPQAGWHVYRVLKQKKVEILNTHSSLDSWVASFAARMARIPVVRTRHLSVPLRTNPLSRLIYSHLCDKIITTGEGIRELLIRELRLDPLKVIAIPTGVDLDCFDPRKVEGDKVRTDLYTAH